MRRPTSGSRRRSQKRSARPRPPFPHKILSSQSIATTMMWLSYHKSVGQSRVCQKYVFGGAHSDVIIVGGAYSNVSSSAYSNVNIVRTIWPFLYDDILPASSFHRILPFDLCPSELLCLVHLIAALSCVYYILLNVKLFAITIFKFDVIKFPSNPNYPSTSRTCPFPMHQCQ